MTTAGELLSRAKWYQVVFLAGDLPGCEVRGRIQARTPDSALRAMMRAHGVPFACNASVWRLGQAGAPSTRVNVRCRLPGTRILYSVSVGAGSGLPTWASR